MEAPAKRGAEKEEGDQRKAKLASWEDRLGDGVTAGGGGTGGEGESDLEAEDSFGREPEDPPLHKKASRRARGAATPTRKKDWKT